MFGVASAYDPVAELHRGQVHIGHGGLFIQLQVVRGNTVHFEFLHQVRREIFFHVLEEENTRCELRNIGSSYNRSLRRTIRLVKSSHDNDHIRCFQPSFFTVSSTLDRKRPSGLRYPCGTSRHGKRSPLEIFFAVDEINLHPGT